MVSVRPKFGIGYGIGQKYRYQSQKSFAETDFFFFKFYSFFPTSWENTSFLSLNLTYDRNQKGGFGRKLSSI